MSEHGKADTPTLWGDWTTQDLVAHLLVRENRPLASLGIAIGPLSGLADRAMARVCRKDFGVPWKSSATPPPPPAVTVTGPVSERVLLHFGRREFRNLEYDGPAGNVALLRGADLGFWSGRILGRLGPSRVWETERTYVRAVQGPWPSALACTPWAAKGRDRGMDGFTTAWRTVREDDLAHLAAIQPPDHEHDPGAEVFAGQSREVHRQRLVLQGLWRSLGDWSPSTWCLHFVVEHHEQIVGIQTLEAQNFTSLRTVDSGSWLVASSRGRGIGVAMREAVLGLAFDHLGAQAAVSSARQCRRRGSVVGALGQRSVTRSFASSWLSGQRGHAQRI